MTMATLKGIRRSNRELEAAVKQAFAVFGEPLQLSTSSSNGRDFISYEVYARDEVWAETATRVFVHVEPLLEFGRPKNITPQMWLWSSRFMTITLSVNFPFRIYWHEYSTTDPEGNTHTKAGLRAFAMNVSVSGGRSYGLGDWHTKRAGLLAWAETFKNETVRRDILKAITLADDEVAKWKKSTADMAAAAEALR